MKRTASIGAILLFVALLALPLYLARAASNSHNPIVIAADSDFLTCGCVASGSGSAADPYIIGPMAINGTSGSNIAVSIDGSSLTKSFNLFNLTISGNGSNASTGIFLNHINSSGTSSILAQVTGPQTSIQSNGIGIVVKNSNNVTLDGGGANSNGPGIGKMAGAINKNFVGAIDVENSSNITVRGWQFSADGQDNTPDYIAFDPSLSNWGVGAVRLFKTSNSTIDHTSANNCTTVSFAVFSSNHNTVSNNSADYPFTNNVLISDGSSYNTVINNSFSTADFVGIMIADPLPGTATLNTYGPAHDNLVTGNVDHTDGPTGAEKSAGIAPAFLGGIVILNGTYNNTISNNQVFSSTGADLGWAQAVPNPQSPIGVFSYPPLLHCNVSASEGGGGTANHNGNVWSGNTVRIIDSCITQQ
ncbi:MAG TPA: hypothetical protein VNY56_07190 [Methylomirabilota bacterium]|nr:hypothetical protein [Methylomirabilota bacterium]